MNDNREKRSIRCLEILDDDDCMEYLNDWDKKIPNLDVVDDYKTEKQQIRACQGKDFPFSFGDVSSPSTDSSHIIFVF